MGITVMIVMMTDFVTFHDRYNRYAVSCMKSVTLTCRCLCGHCSIMLTSAECICCREISAIVAVNWGTPCSVVCIVMHEISDTNLQVFVWPLFDHANKCRVYML